MSWESRNELTVWQPAANKLRTRLSVTVAARKKAIPRSLLDRLHVVCSTECFRLTLTLSLRESEQQASDWCLADGRWANSGRDVIEKLWTILPLPRGEGRLPAATAAAQAGGEGERSVVQPNVPSVTRSARGSREENLSPELGGAH